MTQEVLSYRLLLASARLEGDQVIRRELVLPARETPIVGCYARCLDQLQVDFAAAITADQQTRPRTVNPLPVPVPQDEHAAMYTRTIEEPDPAKTLDTFKRQHAQMSEREANEALDQITEELLKRTRRDPQETYAKIKAAIEFTESIGK